MTMTISRIEVLISQDRPLNFLTEPAQENTRIEMDEKTEIVLKRIAETEPIDIRPLKRRKITLKATDFGEKLAGLRLALNLPESMERTEKLNELKGFLNSPNLISQPKDEIIELTALLFEGMRDFPEIFDQRIEFSNIPDFAKQYYEILKNLQDRSIDLHEAYKRMEEAALNDLNFPFYSMAANIINIRKIPIKNLRNLAGWKTLDRSLLAPLLRHVDLRNLSIDSIKLILKSLNNVNSLTVNNSNIKELPPLPNCQTLDCEYCDSIVALPNLPNCQRLNCRGCFLLSNLPELPSCSELLCDDCSALTYLPDLPNCIELVCENCYSLNALPLLPQCRTLICSGCIALQSLPELSNCQNLNCDDCSALTLIPALPKCIELFCNNCHSLVAFDMLPNCQLLSCSDCPALILFPLVLPSCTQLFCRNCPMSDRQPELPLNAWVDAGLNHDAVANMTIDIDDLVEKPKKYLDELGKYLLKGQSFPNIYYIKDGEISKGVDTGGLSRDFVTRIFKSIFAKKADEWHLMCLNFTSKEGVEPLALESESLSYQVLGQILLRCYLGESNFTTGSVFRTSFFQSLLNFRTSSDNEQVKIYINFKLEEESMKKIKDEITSDLDPEKNFDAAYAACALVELEEEIDIKCKTHEDYQKYIWPEIVKAAKSNGYVRAISWIAAEFKKGLVKSDLENLNQMSAIALQEKIQGRLTAKLLKEKTKYEKSSHLILDKDLDKVKIYLENWIDSRNSDELTLFLEGVTANSTLGKSNIKIEVYHSGEQFIPRAHTCYFSLEVSSEYKNQEAFNKAIQIFLDHSRTGTGFQFI